MCICTFRQSFRLGGEAAARCVRLSVAAAGDVTMATSGRGTVSRRR